MSGRQAYPVPCATLYLGLYTAHMFPLKLAEVYREMAAGAQVVELGAEEEICARVEALVRSYETFDPPFAWLRILEWRPVDAYEGVRVELAEGSCVRIDREGNREELLAPLDTTATHTWEKETPTIEQLDELLPIVDSERLIAAGCHELARRLVERCGEDVWLHSALGSPYEYIMVLGFVGMMEAMRRDPGLIAAIVERALHNDIEYSKLIAAAGVSGVFIEQCWASSDLISEKDYCRFALPADEELVEELKEQGFEVVFHMTGGIEGRLPHLRELGVDAIALEDSKKNFEVDIGRVRREIGEETALWGNINPVIIRDGPAERIEAEVRRQFEAAGPPFVVSCGSPLTLDTTVENVNVMLQAAAGLPAY